MEPGASTRGRAGSQRLTPSVPSGVSEKNTAKVLSLRSARVPVDNDNDLLTEQLAGK